MWTRSTSPTLPPYRPSFVFFHVQMLSDNTTFTILFPQYFLVIIVIFGTFCSTNPPLEGDIYLATDSIEEGRWQCDLFNCYYLNSFHISLLANILNFWQLAWRTCCTLFLGKALKSTAYNAAEIVVLKIKIILELTKKERKTRWD